jgi:Leucine-rich repeat (LRR) protein
MAALILSSNAILEIPESISGCTGLQYLDLRSNSISFIPESIGLLVNLQDLLMSNNNLTSIPDAIGLCISLKHLLLNENQIASIPESIGNCDSLIRLEMRSNELSSIPDELMTLNIEPRDTIHLYYGDIEITSGLNINNNRLCFLPEETVIWINEHTSSFWQTNQDCSSADPSDTSDTVNNESESDGLCGSGAGLAFFPIVFIRLFVRRRKAVKIKCHVAP